MIRQSSICPFPLCHRSTRNSSKGWTDRGALLHHVNAAHVNHGEVPGSAWLTSMDRWMCVHCLHLVPLRRTCVGGGDDCFTVLANDVPSRMPPGDRPIQLPAHPAPIVCTPLATPCPAMERILHDILSVHRPLLRHVPRGIVPLWGAAFANAVDALVQGQTWESLRDLMVFAKVTLHSPRGGKQHKGHVLKRLRENIQRFQSGDAAAMWCVVPFLPRPGLCSLISISYHTESYRCRKYKY